MRTLKGWPKKPIKPLSELAEIAVSKAQEVFIAKQVICVDRVKSSKLKTQMFH